MPLEEVWRSRETLQPSQLLSHLLVRRTAPARSSVRNGRDRDNMLQSRKTVMIVLPEDLE